MEKINIAELLKDCPKGMEMDCAMYNKVFLLSVDDKEDTIFPIRAFREDGNSISLTKYGQFTNADFARCIIFPKGKTTWEGFVPPCKFKVGDRVRNKNYKDYIYDIYDITDKGYRAKEINADSPLLILFGSQEDNYELVPKKFNINTLKPFDKVLVRDSDELRWAINLFGFYVDTDAYPFKCCGHSNLGFAQCIPYEGNQHLLGTTDDCDDFYKTWE